MHIDRYEYKNEGEEQEEFSTCANSKCKAVLYVGEEILEHYGMVCCRNLSCLIAITETKEEIAQYFEE